MNQLSQHRQKLADLEGVLSQFEQPEFKTEHFFAHGTYTRVLHLPKDTVLTGKIHRYSCVNIVPKGKIAVITDEGEYEITGPYVFVSGAGVNKAGLVLEDTIWINVHPWDGDEDLEQIEREVIIPSYEALETEENRICRG